jgi:hypothetical protein
MPCSGSRAARDQVGEQRSREGRVFGAAFPEPKRDFDALGRDPEADDVDASLQLEPVDHHRRQPHVVEAAAHQLGKRPARPLDERARHGRARRRPRLLLDLQADRLLRAPVAAGRDAGEHPLQHRLGQRVAVGEVRVRLQPHLLAPVGAADARTLERDPSAAERHLARFVPMPDSGALRVVLALGTDDLDDFLFHQLGEHAQPDTDTQGEQSLPRRADQLPERVLHPRRQRELTAADLLPRYGLHGVPPVSIDDFALATVASRPDEAGGPPPQVLRAMGQPPSPASAGSPAGKSNRAERPYEL